MTCNTVDQGQRKLFMTGQAKLNLSIIQLNEWAVHDFTTATLFIT